MSEFEVIEESPVTLVELKVALKSLASGKEQESFRIEKTKAYLEAFATESEKETKNLTQKITDLNIPRLKERQIIKIIDLMPKDLDSLKMMFSAENLTIKDEDLKKILDVIPQ